MHIGMRNIKTALAVLVAIAITGVFNLVSPFYAAIAAFVTMQSSVIASYKTGAARMIGTFIGAGVGILCAYIYPQNAATTGIGVVVLIYLCNVLKIQDAIPNAGIVLLAIMLNVSKGNVMIYSFYRIVDTFIGVVIAILVNYFIFHPKDNKM